MDDVFNFRHIDSKNSKGFNSETWSQNYIREAPFTEMRISAIEEDRLVKRQEHSVRKLLRTDLETKRIQQRRDMLKKFFFKWMIQMFLKGEVCSAR